LENDLQPSAYYSDKYSLPFALIAVWKLAAAILTDTGDGNN
jgi:hypothetical protein